MRIGRARRDVARLETLDKLLRSVVSKINVRLRIPVEEQQHDIDTVSHNSSPVPPSKMRTSRLLDRSLSKWPSNAVDDLAHVRKAMVAVWFLIEVKAASA
mmetsp:Transcript_51486/g.154565  ORF Transcript_51486/g.154565 Transcript_51486/m.154565 type:complete len:100 (+) Transcript_51486:815-1114(+)